MIGINEDISISVVYNNIIVGNDNYGVQICNDTEMDYNNVWNPGTNYYNCNAGINSISENPLFIDQQNSNYRLSAGSLCINAGIPNEKFYDLDGSRNDMGAYGGPYADQDWINFGCSIKADSIVAALNDTIVVSVTGTQIENVAQVLFDIIYDQEKIKFINAYTTEISNGFALTKTQTSDRKLSIAMDGVDGIKDKQGRLLKLYFCVCSPEQSETHIHFDSVTLTNEVMSKKIISEVQDGVIRIMKTDEVVNREQVPLTYYLNPCYPNTFNPTTTISFELPKETYTEIKIYNLAGQLVQTLLNEVKPAGQHQIIWNAGNLPSGIYFYQIKVEDPAGSGTGDFTKTKKCILLK